MRGYNFPQLHLYAILTNQQSVINSQKFKMPKVKCENQLFAGMRIHGKFR